MSEQEIIQGNKLIAEFMGLTIITDEISLFDTNYKPLAKYHESWNDLMPVVEKIENLGYSVEIFKSASHLEPDKIWHRCVIEKMTNWNIKLSSGECDDETGKQYIKTENKILSAWLAVVEFIKWYNLNYKSNEN